VVVTLVVFFMVFLMLLFMLAVLAVAIPVTAALISAACFAMFAVTFLFLVVIRKRRGNKHEAKKENNEKFLQHIDIPYNIFFANQMLQT
jgi:membrane protein implicated in regulation of membrane protease activity